MANTWCKHLTNTSRLSAENGRLISTPCCWVGEMAIVDENFIQHRKNITENICNNKEIHCNECIMRESSGYEKSMRTVPAEIIPDEIGDYNWSNLMIQIDPTCNAACVMCDPKYSTKWREQSPFSYNVIDVENMYNTIYETHDLSKLARITFFGGEPFLSKHNYKLLENIPNPEQVIVQFATNGSIMPDLMMLSKFKVVRLLFSIDGIGNQFEYIRWPLKWDVITKNLNTIIQSTIEQNLQLVVSFNYTVNPLNIFYYDQFEQWALSLKHEYDNIIKKIMVGACYSLYWGIDGTPLSIRSMVYDKYGADHKLVKMLNSHPLVPGKFSELLKFAKQLDAKRNNSIYDTFPILTTISDSV